MFEAFLFKPLNGLNFSDLSYHFEYKDDNIYKKVKGKNIQKYEQIKYFYLKSPE